MTAWTALLSFLAAFAAPATPSGAPAATHRLAIIVNRSENVSDISLEDLRRIYVGRITRFPGRHRVIPVILDSREPAQRFFLRYVVRMVDLDFTQLWIGNVFRGEVASTPHVAKSPADARQFVAGHPHAIAYVDVEIVDGTVKMLTVDGKRYDAPDYPLTWEERP